MTRPERVCVRPGASPVPPWAERRNVPFGSDDLIGVIMRRHALYGPLGLLGAAVLVACAAPAGVPTPSATEPARTTSTPSGTSGPSVSPTPTGPDPTPTAPARQRLVIHGTGDVNVDPSYIPALRARGYDHAWAGMEGLFVDDDLTIVNLECPVSELGDIEPKEFNFRCDPAALPAAREAGVDVTNLANNHVRDYGVSAMLDSITQVRNAGIEPVGVGADVAAANEPAIVERGGWRIAVLGFGGVVPTADWVAGPSRPGMASGDDIDAMTDAIRAADEVADLVFVTIHWGVELDTEPRAEDVSRAEAMIDAGADGIFGHHSHRLNPLETYADRPIAWGLGNFVWPNLSEAGSRSAVAEFVVEPDGSVRGCLLPAFIASAGHPELTGDRSC